MRGGGGFPVRGGRAGAGKRSLLRAGTAFSSCGTESPHVQCGEGGRRGPQGGGHRTLLSPAQGRLRRLGLALVQG